MHKSNQKVLIYGTGKISQAIASYFKNPEILSWRHGKKIRNRKYSSIYIVGYDFSSTLDRYDIFYQKNITKPLSVLSRYEYIKEAQIIYLNTKNDGSQFTRSRYYYGKQKLSYELSKRYKNLINVSLPSIENDRGVVLHGGMISKFILGLAFRFFKVDKIHIENVYHYIRRSIEINANIRMYRKIKPISSIGLRWPRPLLVDRAIRFIYG